MYGKYGSFPLDCKATRPLAMLMEFSRCDSSNHEVLSLCAPPEVRLASGNDIGKDYMTSSLNLDPINNNWTPLGGQNVPSPTSAQATCSNLHLAEEPEGTECSPACICAPGAAIVAHNSTSFIIHQLYLMITHPRIPL